MEHVPYESMWIHLGERWDNDPVSALRRIAHDGRGGYCYHLNGALSVLLGALGYRVSCHIGGVHGPEGADAATLTNHFVLAVSDLPTEANPGGRWYVDAGLGGRAVRAHSDGARHLRADSDDVSTCGDR